MQKSCSKRACLESLIGQTCSNKLEHLPNIKFLLPNIHSPFSLILFLYSNFYSRGKSLLLFATTICGYARWHWILGWGTCKHSRFLTNFWLFACRTFNKTTVVLPWFLHITLSPSLEGENSCLVLKYSEVDRCFFENKAADSKKFCKQNNAIVCSLYLNIEQTMVPKNYYKVWQ